MANRFFGGISVKGAARAGGLVALALALAPAAAHACPTDPYLGTICMTAATFCPAPDYKEANGQLLAINDNPALYSLLGDNYGGDGRNTFGLPDLRSRLPIGAGQGPGLRLIQPGDMSGEEDRVMHVLQMPAHTHDAEAEFAPHEVEVTLEASQLPGGSGSPATGDYIAGGTSIYRSGSPGPTAELGGVSVDGGGGTVAVTVGSAGTSAPFETYDPSVGVLFCIAVSGLYPPRN